MNSPVLSHIHTSAELTLAGTETLAATLAKNLRPTDMLTLRGVVGAGKTTFARALIQAIAPQQVEVTSPTFNLMQSYDVTLEGGKPETLWHLDLYRLEKASEAEMLGLRELEAHIMLIEWPEIIEHTLPAARLDVTLAFGRDMQTRIVTLHGGEAWSKRIASLGL